VTTGHASTADAALLEELRQSAVTVGGRPISVTQLQAWRRHGLIDRPSTTSRGRRGRESTYGSNMVEQVSQVAGWLSENRNLHGAVLAAFGLGRNPPEKHLRMAYQAVIEDQQKQAGAALDNSMMLAALVRALFHNPAAFGALGPTLTHPVRPNNVATRDEMTGQVQGAAKLKQQRLGTLLGVVEDGAETLEEPAAAAGLDAHLAEQTGAALEDVRHQFAQLPMASFGQMLERLRTASYEALLWRRNLLLGFAQCLASVRPQLVPGGKKELGTLVAMLVVELQGHAPDIVLTDADWQECRVALTELFRVESA